MANGFVLRRIPLAAAALSWPAWGQGFNPEFPLGNLVDVQPKVVAQTDAAPSGNFFALIEVDLGADSVIDTLVLMHTNLSSAAQWRVFGVPAATSFGSPDTEPSGQLILGFAGWTNFGVAPTTQQRRRHALAIGAPVTVRRLRIYVTDNTAQNPEAVIRLGTLGIGKRWGPAFNFEQGSGRRIEDRSSMRDMPGGEIAGLRGARVPVTRVTWGDMTEAELLELWDIILDAGESAPLFLIEDPDPTTGQCERIHYGLQSSDFYERTMADKSRIELRLKEWL